MERGETGERAITVEATVVEEEVSMGIFAQGKILTS
jgi:hypothetical protein